MPTAVHSPQTRDPLRPAPVAADDAGPEGPLLSRRVPQAHLAPELRRHGREGATAGPDGALPDAAEARAALSRYQASRQAAKAAVDDGRSRRGRSRAPAGRRRMVVTAAGTVDGRQLDWLLVDFVRSTAGARHALVVSADGLRLAASQGVDEALGDQLAAVTSGLLSLAQGIARTYGAGPVRQTIVEMTGGYLFLTSISEGSMLAVFAERACDMGMIGYEMTLLAARVGHMLTPGRRSTRPGPPERMPR